jgi:hypothetical protein
MYFYNLKCSPIVLKGIHCETPYCPTLYCLNGGTCHVNRQVKGHLGRDLLNCTCPLGFTGSRCEHRRQSQSNNNNNNFKLRHSRHHQQQNGSVNLNGVRIIFVEFWNYLDWLCDGEPCRFLG